VRRKKDEMTNGLWLRKALQCQYIQKENERCEICPYKNFKDINFGGACNIKKIASDANEYIDGLLGEIWRDEEYFKSCLKSEEHKCNDKSTICNCVDQEVMEWLKELALGDELPVRDYGYKETARLAKKCLALLNDYKNNYESLIDGEIASIDDGN
jgi:hypothetical protein